MKKSNRKIRFVETDGRQYYAYELVGKIYGKRKRLYAETKEELEQQIHQAEEERLRSLFSVLPSKPVLKDYANLYLKNEMIVSNPNRVTDDVMLAKNFLYGSEIDKNISEITSEDVRRFYKRLQSESTATPTEKLNDMLKRIFEFAELSGAETVNPEQFQIQDETLCADDKNLFLSEQEMDYLMNTCKSFTKSGRSAWVVIFMLYTGIRFRDIPNIRHGGLHMEQKTVTVCGREYELSDECIVWLEQRIVEKAIAKPKWRRNSDSDETAISPMLSHLYDDLERRKIFIANYLEQTAEDIFFTNANDKPVTYKSTNLFLKQALKKCSFPENITLNMLHRSFIAKELKHGVTSEKLTEVYGYSRKRFSEIFLNRT